MIRQLIVNNVLHRPIRTIVSVIAVGVEVALVILIVGLTSGLLQETCLLYTSDAAAPRAKREIFDCQEDLVQPHGPARLARANVWRGRETRCRHRIFRVAARADA